MITEIRGIVLHFIFIEKIKYLDVGVFRNIILVEFVFVRLFFS
jgi:hypothetical protein